MHPKPEETKHPFHAMAEAHRANRSHLVWWRAMAVLTMPWAVIATGWAVYEIKTDPKLEKVFVLVSEDTRVLATSVARTWTFDEQAKADIARHWVWYMRTRPLQDYAAVGLRGQAAMITAKGSQAASDANLMITEIDQKLKHQPNKNETELALEVREGMETTIVGADEESKAAVIQVYWQERTLDELGNKGPWEHRYMALSVQEVEQTDTAEIMANGTGLYVVEITKLGLGRPANYKTAEAQ